MKTKITAADSMPLTGMENVANERQAALETQQGIELTEAMKSPRKDISTNAGKMERDSPLFFGTGSNPSLF